MESGLAALWPFLFAAVLFVMLKLGYSCLGLMFCRHPLTAGIILWLVTGEAGLLLAAVFFELLWLDLFYAGTYVPPDNLFSYMIFAPLMIDLGLEEPQDLCVVMLFCLPFAALAGKLEARMRFRESAGHKRMNQAIDARGDIEATAAAIVWRSLSRLALLGIMLYSLTAILIYGVAALWIWKFGSVYRIEWAGWGFLLCLAALGGLLSLRIPWARVCFGACVLVAGGLYVF
jgi:PTS system mannose-specific IIC component